MASSEVKVSVMTFLEDVPNDAKLYVVKPGDTTPYYTTKAALLAGISGGSQSLPEVLAVGDRTIRLSDGDGETILELNDRGKLIDNGNADYLYLTKDLFPDDTVLKIYNYSETELFGILNEEYGTIIQINDSIIDEYTGITLKPGIAILKKMYGSEYEAEAWILSYEALDLSKDAIGLGNVDNTADLSKPVSTAQAAAIASALSTAQSYTDNIKLKRPARVAIDTNVSLSGDLTVGSIVLVTGDVVLCLAQTDAKQNGLWVVNQLGPWVRTQDFRTGLDVSFCWIPVLAGNYAARFFSTGANRIVGTDNISLQDQTFLALLTGISFSDGTDVTAANTVLQALGKLQKQLTDVRAAKQDKTTVFKNTTQTVVTGTTGEVIIYAEEVLANTLSNNTILSFKSRFGRNPRVNTCALKLYINTVNNLSGSPVAIAQVTIAGNVGVQSFIREQIFIKDNVLSVLGSSNSASDVPSGGGVFTTSTYNINTTYYWILTAQPNTSTDSLTHNFSILEKN